jgi:hypothetical protein
MKRAKTKFSTEMFAGAVLSLDQYLAPQLYVMYPANCPGLLVFFGFFPFF